MPPLFTSTTLGTLFRQALAVARHVHPSPLLANRSIHRINGAKLSPIQRARLVARRFAQRAHETFPSLSTPSHRLGYALEPVRLPTRAGGRRHLQHPQGGAVQSRLYCSTRSTFQMAYRLPAHARGPRVSSNVGLGSARAYSGGGAGGSQTAQRLMENIPLGFRALYEGLKDEDLEGRCSIKPTKRYRPYCPAAAASQSKRQCRRNRRTTATRSERCPSNVSLGSSRSASRCGSILADRAHYFPLRASAALAREADATPALLIPEALVTPGTVTTLVLPIAATLQAILQPTTHIPYADAELGVAVYAELFHGLGEVALASDQVLGCVLPVLARLRSLGLHEQHTTCYHHQAAVVGSVTRDIWGEPQTIVFEFHNRSESDVKTLLGQTLQKNVLNQEWWHMQERRQLDRSDTPCSSPAAIAEDAVAAEAWASTAAPAAGSHARDVQVIMPTISLDPMTVADLSDSWQEASPTHMGSVIAATPALSRASSRSSGSPYFDEDGTSVLSAFSPCSDSSDGVIQSPSDGRLAGHFSPQDLRERLALFEYYSADDDEEAYDRFSLSDSASISSGWSSSGPSETDEAVELSVEPAMLLSPPPLLEEVPQGQTAGIEGFDHGLMVVNYW